MIHPDTELRFKNPAVGYGVFATRPIPRGTIVWTLCQLDRRLTPAERAAYPGPYLGIIDRYAYIDASGDFILCWDHGRYVNHSCAPAMLGIGPEVEIAVRDLAPGDELTCDYGTLNLLEPLECSCNAPNCRGRIGGADVLDLWAELDRQSSQAMLEMRQVAQPLLPFVGKLRELFEWVDGVKPVPSARSYHYARP